MEIQLAKLWDEGVASLMIFAEPPATRFDVRFRLGAVPVRVHPFFWVSTIGLSFRPGIDLFDVMVWSVAAFVSILIHELGHAAAFRRLGFGSRVTLYGFGGLASPDVRDGREGPAGRDNVFVSAAGPFAGFAFAAIVGVVVLRLGYRLPLLVWTLGSGPLVPSRALRVLVSDVLLINVVWGLVNLLPVHPLDGGQIALEIARARDPVHGAARSLRLSFWAAVLAAMAGLALLGDWYVALLFGYLACMSALVLRRRYRLGLAALTGVGWLRRRWLAWAGRRSARKTRARVLEDVRRLDGMDSAPTANPEIDKVVGELFDAVSKNVTASKDAKNRTPKV